MGSPAARKTPERGVRNTSGWCPRTLSDAGRAGMGTRTGAGGATTCGGDGARAPSSEAAQRGAVRPRPHRHVVYSLACESTVGRRSSVHCGTHSACLGEAWGARASRMRN